MPSPQIKLELPSPADQVELELGEGSFPGGSWPSSDGKRSVSRRRRSALRSRRGTGEWPLLTRVVLQPKTRYVGDDMTRECRVVALTRKQRQPISRYVGAAPL